MRNWPFTVLLDMDSTVYDLMTEWLDWYNEGQWSSSYRYMPLPADFRPMSFEDVGRWSWHLDTHPDCQEKLYRFFKEGTFYRLPLFAGAREAIREVHNRGVRQVFVSTSTTYSGAYEKQQAVERDFPFIGKENVVVTGGTKGVFLADVLLDDKPDNLVEFNASGAGIGALARLQPLGYNAEYAANPFVPVLESWEDYPALVSRLAEDPYAETQSA
jgi:5'(3')-deoxyribonucleotidase